MSGPLSVLMVEDVEDDAALLSSELRRHGYQLSSERVETAAEMRRALDERDWDLILADFSLPGFGGREALEVLGASGKDIPLIIVTGSITDESAVAAMRAGARDFVLKDNLARLFPAIDRERMQARERAAARELEEDLAAARRAQLEQLAERARVFESLATLGSKLAGRVDRQQIAEAAVEHAFALVEAGGVWLAVDEPGAPGLELLAQRASDRPLPRRMPREQGATARAIRTAEPIFVEDYQSWPEALEFKRSSGVGAVAAVPLRAGDRVIGALGGHWTALPADRARERMQFFELIAAEVGPALQAASLHAELEAALHVVARRARQQEAIAELGRLGLTRPAPERLDDVAAELVRAALDADVGCVWEATPQARGPRLRVAAGLGQDWRQTPDAGERSLEASTLRTDAPVVFEGRRGRRLRLAPVLASAGLVSGATVRIPDDVRPAVLGAYSRCKRRFSQDDLAFLEAVANVVAQMAGERRAADALRESESKYRWIVETAEEGIWAIDLEARITFANPRLAEMLGCSLGELVGRPIYDFMSPALRPEARRHVENRRRGVAERFEFRLRRKDGEEFPVLVSTSLLEDDTGTLVGSAAMVSDLSARKQAERDLQESQARLRTVVDNAPIVLFSLDSRGVLTLAEGNGLQRIGLSTEQLIGFSIFEMFPDESDLMVKARAVLAGELAGDGFEVEALGAVWSVLFEAQRGADGRVQSLVGVAYDVTDRRQAAEARSESETKSKFLASMSHELRTPLNSILGFSQLLLLQDAEPLSERQRRHVSNIEASGRHLLDLINDLLDLSKVAAGEMLLEMEDVDLVEVVGESLTRMAPLAEGKSLRLERTGGSRSLPARADRRRVVQVLLNLLSNAIKFTPPGGASRCASSGRGTRP